METHDLTEKELKAIDNAVSTLKKFAKYIKTLNIDNYWLRKNLDEAIKAGDVTNAQKVDLRAAADTAQCFDDSLKALQEECRKGNCPIGLDDNQHCPDSCELKQKLIVLDWMRAASRGHKDQWKYILQYALNGRKLWLNKHYNYNFKVEA